MDQLFGPVAEKLDVGHEVEVGLPEGLLTLQVLINQEHDQGQLLPVALLIAEDVRVLPDDLAEDRVPLGALHREQHLVRHADEGLSVLDRLLGPHADKTALEIGRVLKLGDQNAILRAPCIENLALTHVLLFPLLLILLCDRFHR